LKDVDDKDESSERKGLPVAHHSRTQFEHEHKPCQGENGHWDGVGQQRPVSGALIWNFQNETVLHRVIRVVLHGVIFSH